MLDDLYKHTAQRAGKKGDIKIVKRALGYDSTMSYYCPGSLVPMPNPALPTPFFCPPPPRSVSNSAPTFANFAKEIGNYNKHYTTKKGNAGTLKELSPTIKDIKKKETINKKDTDSAKDYDNSNNTRSKRSTHEELESAIDQDGHNNSANTVNENVDTKSSIWFQWLKGSLESVGYNTNYTTTNSSRIPIIGNVINNSVQEIAPSIAGNVMLFEVLLKKLGLISLGNNYILPTQGHTEMKVDQLALNDSLSEDDLINLLFQGDIREYEPE